MPRSPLRTTVWTVLALIGLAWATSCGGGSTDLGGGGGGGGGEQPNPPAQLAYAEPTAWYPIETGIAPNVPSWEGGTPTSFQVDPALPAGLAIDVVSGVISGTTTRALAPVEVYRVTAANADGQTTADVRITVGPIATLAAGFEAEIVADGLAEPVRMGVAPDGRIFFNELGTGRTRILHADGTLQATPFAEAPVRDQGHQGLLGLALHPDFASNGYVYVVACTPEDAVSGDRMRILRYTETAGQPQATLTEVVVDELPVADINNGGDLAFGIEGPDRVLYLTIGDLGVEALAQTDGSPAGRLHRFTDEGGIPADNPDPADSEWCRGLRNTFGIAVHPTTGDVFGVDNGPMANDELNYLYPGRNFEWGGPANGNAGLIIQTWVDVIVPTSLLWHTGAGWGSTFENDLFLASYADEVVRRFSMLAPWYVDVEEEATFLTFHASGQDNKPLDLEMAPDGSIYVSTFSAIYRITRP